MEGKTVKVQVSRQALLDGVAKVHRAADPKARQPILANILLEAKWEFYERRAVLKLTATDFEIAIQAPIAVDMERPGRITVNAKALHSIVKALSKKQETVILEVEDGDEHWLTLRCGRTTARLAGMPADEFPGLPQIEAKGTIELSSEVLREMADKLLHAVSTDETRYVLNGVYLKAEGTTLKAVATDGHRLAVLTIQLSKPTDTPVSGVVKRQAIHEAYRLSKGDSVPVKVAFGQDHSHFHFPDATLYSRAIEGQFPNYEQIIPEHSDVVATFDRKAALDALKRLQTITKGQRTGMVIWTFSNGMLVLKAEDTETGSMEETLDVSHNGNELTIGLNPRYLHDAFEAMDTVEVRAGFTDKLAPALFEPVGDNGYQCVVMPIRV
ncbi:DNA polymerase III subunit beta [Nitrospinae bacterium AH_259_B05_G02_I21]|nr:DNA polymerase III subunit beta [Nitrospinae bacterium AH_259_B05_G02_I21]MDA2932571.1 DNA polymerase III subunit beta [Nitrospinae bacterium AH-259-F20]